MEITAQNAIYLGEETGGKGRQFKARFLVPGLVKYDYGVCLLTKENADKFIQGFTGCPVIINHQTVTDKNVKDIAVGDIFSVWFDEKDGYYWCNGILRDKEAIKLINEGYSVSCQYLITEYSDNTSGALHNGNPYDKVIENGKPEHLAIVNNPRYEGAIIAVNAILAQNEDQWITIKPNGEEAKGRHLLIKEGESVHEAMERTYGIDGAKGQQKLFDTSKDRKTKEDYKREADEKQKKADEHAKQVQKRYDNLEHLGVAEPDKLDDVEGEEMSYEKWITEKTKSIEDGIKKDFEGKEIPQKIKEDFKKTYGIDISEDKKENEDIFSLVKSILYKQKENQGSAKIQQVEKELKSVLKQKGYTFLDENNYFVVFKNGKSLGGFFIDDDERWGFGKEEEDIAEQAKEDKQEPDKEEKGEDKKYDEIVEEYKDYFNESQLKEFKKELARFDEYKGLENIDLKDSKETFKKLKPEDALERLKRSNDWVEKNNKEEKLKKRFYDYVDKNDFKDQRVNELARFIGGFEKLGLDKPITFEEMKNDPRYGFKTELALKYLADKKGFDNYSKDNEEDRIKAGFDKFIEIVYGKSQNKDKKQASNSFVEQFKDTLYTVLAEEIYNRLGE